MADCNKSNIEHLSVWPPPTTSKVDDIRERNLQYRSPIINSALRTADHYPLNTDLSLKRSKTSSSTLHDNGESSDESAETTTTAETLLASWWRCQLRSKKQSRLSTEGKIANGWENSISEISCPRAKINAIKRHPSAKAFLWEEARKLQNIRNPSSKQQYLLSTILFNLAVLNDNDKSKMEKEKCLALLNEARFELNKCITSVTFSHLTDELDKLPHRVYLEQIEELTEFQKEALTFSIQLHLQIGAINSLKNVNSKDRRIEKSDIGINTSFEKVFLQNDVLVSNLFDQNEIRVERVKASDLSVERFMKDYCMKQKPLVITNLNVSEIASKAPWNLNHISDVAGSSIVTLKKPSKESVEWAKLDPSAKMSVAEFISKVKSKTSGMNYLFDWSLPLFCPALNAEFTIPAYFQHDYLKRTSEDALYHQSWPSLFISSKGSLSELHVDAFGSNFWMYLFQGRKRWTFFPPQLANLLRPKYYGSFDPVFDVDLSRQQEMDDAVKGYACEVVLEAGELLFVPFGSPHRVENLEDSIAVSGNFVDQSNVKCVAKHLRRNAFQDPRAGDLLKEFVDLKLV